MIDFNGKKFSHVRGKETEYSEYLTAQAESIQKYLQEWKMNFFYLGVHLIELFNSNAYSLYASKCNFEQLRSEGWNIPSGAGNCCSTVFFAYCFEKFGLDKSQVSRYMNIVDEFGDEFRGFAKPWDKFSYSQLVELLPLSAEQRKLVKSSWTIKQIRDYKKSLVSMPQPNADELTEAEEPPQSKYARFEKWTKNELCDKIFELEAERESLLQEIETLQNAAKSAA